MHYRHNLVLYQTVTPLHIGCGQDIGVVDLPVFRERTTAYPLIPGSGIRGAVRALFERTDESLATKLFGPRVGDPGEASAESSYAGSVAIHDGKLVLFPVRSDRGLFLWVTCPAAIARLAREAGVFLEGGASGWDARGAGGSLSDEELLGPESLGADPARDAVHLEELRFRPIAPGDGVGKERESLAALAGKLGDALGRPEIAHSTVLISDRSFSHFVRHATMVLQRNALDAAKTVRDGALFTLEAVPPEAVFFGFMGATAARWQAAEATASEPPGDREEAGGSGEETAGPDSVLGTLRARLTGDQTGAQAVLHLGGDESVGLGVTRLIWVGSETTGKGAEADEP